MGIYVVRPGDTLSGIAKRSGATVRKLQSLNPQISDPDRIFIGMALNVPGESPIPRVNPVEGDAPWYQIAMEELAGGVAEIPGSDDNPRILEYHATCSLHATNDETAWCSAFVNWCITQAKRVGTNDAAARSWLTWKHGSKLRQPRVGAIVVLRRGTHPWQGHVGFFVDQGDGYVRLLGGNQGNAVSIASYPKERVLGTMWPK